MKKVLLFLFLINLSLFAQSYVDSLYDAIEENNTKKIIEIANNYKVDLNNIFSERVEVDNDIEGWYANASPLIYAIDCGNIAAIDTLLKLGANIGQLTDVYTYTDFNDAMDMTNRMSITPLMFAAYSDSTGKVVSFLINKGAKVNAKNRDGKTALMYSANAYEGLIAAKILINAGADINAKDNKGRTPIMYASDSHNYGDSKELGDLLIKNRANVNAKDNNGKTALMYAVDEHKEELVDLLIKNKANVNAKDNEGKTALMYACYDFREYPVLNPNIVKSLIRAGANINEVNNGNTALLLAIYTYISGAVYNEEDFNDRTFETIRLLINNGANVNIRNKEGETPLSLSKGFPKLTKLLRDNGAYLQ